MDCRLNGLKKRSPTKVILDRFLKVSSDFKIYNSSTKKNIFLYSVLEMKHHMIKNKFVKKIKVNKKLNNEDFFNFIFEDLANKGVNNLLIETGSIINTLLLSLNLVDELAIFRSGNIIGNDGLPFINSLNFKEINDLTNYKISSIKTFDDNILEIRNLTNKDTSCSQAL
jgi:diaminohydroxyphosphoribosylaminopyrimidine deaminase/5-amino-6-(5-phosphoribosylamino)uracil reductase